MNELLTNAGLTEEQVKAVLEGMKEAKIYTTKEQNIDTRYEKLKTQKADLEVQLATANTAIEDLQKNNLTNTELQAQVEAYKTAAETAKKEADEKVRLLTLDNAINEKLGEFDSKFHALLKGAFDRNTLQVDENGKVNGIDEQYTAIKEQYGELLTVKVQGGTPPNPTTGSKGLTKEQFANMTYSERLEVYNKQPEVYKQLTTD